MVILWTKPDISDVPLFHAIASQTEIMLGYILANEEVEKQAAQIQSLKKELAENAQQSDNEGENFPKIIGSSASMKKALRLASQVSKTQSTVIYTETLHSKKEENH